MPPRASHLSARLCAPPTPQVELARSKVPFAHFKQKRQQYEEDKPVRRGRRGGRVADVEGRLLVRAAGRASRAAVIEEDTQARGHAQGGCRND